MLNFRHKAMQEHKFNPRHCPHTHIQGVYGDAIIFISNGRRLQCMDCWTFLDGPVALNLINRAL